MPIFADPLHEEFATWALGFVPAGGADVGEVQAVAADMQGDDDSAFYDAWVRAAQRHVREAEAAEAAGHQATARSHHLRAACCYGVAYHPLYGTPVDPRLVSAFNGQMASFAKAMALGDPPGEPLDVAYEGHSMPAYFLRAHGSQPGERRPVVLLNNGYDATIADLYFATGHAAVRRGYHCVVFDGPGQGKLLIKDGITMTTAWEQVVSPVVDAVLQRPDVDPQRIVIHGWSLGGHLAARAAAREHRFAACVLDPPLWGVMDRMRESATQMGLSAETAAAMPEISADDAKAMTEIIEAIPRLRWMVIKRGYWVNGATDLASYLRAIAPFTMDGLAEDIRCPVLGTMAEGDVLAAGAQDFLAKLKVPTTLMHFTAAEGAGGHCEMLNRSLVNTRVFDWLDTTLK